MPQDIGDSYESFVKIYQQRSGLDLNAYKRAQMERRIRSFISTHNFKSFQEFLAALDKDDVLFDKFFKHLTINVTHFFRDPNLWKILREKIIPEHFQNKKSLKIWSAGCSGGQEPYSFAITMLEYFPNMSFTILASDLDENMLKHARLGLYKESDFIATPPEIKKKYFVKTDNGFQIRDIVKKNIRFQKQNLLTDPFENGFDIIACRNVVIYFTEETKAHLYKKFFNSLNSGGILFSGSTEHLFGIPDLKFKSLSSFFYQKC